MTVHHAQLRSRTKRVNEHELEQKDKVLIAMTVSPL
jgi:hypothetical protein